MLQIAISGAKRLGDDAWRSSTTPAEIDRLGRSASREPGPSIVYVPVVTEVAEGTIMFPSADARIVNRGTLDDTIIVAHATAETEEPHARHVVPGDRAFVEEARVAGDDVRQFAERMLAAVRELDPEGQLVAFPGRRFINKPDNFVVLVPQPRIRELKIVIRGRPEEFRNPPDDLKPDQNGYSTFKIASARDLACGIRLLQQVRRKQ